MSVRKLPRDQAAPLLAAQAWERKRLGGAADAKRLIQVIHGGYRMVAVGTRLYARPPEEAFSNFLEFILRETLEEKWWQEEASKPDKEQHQIVQLFRGLHEWQAETEKEENRAEGGWAAIPSGDSVTALSLAYDVYSLKKQDSLPRRIIKRLRNEQEFQGVRYEVAIGGIFARAGCTLQWLTVSDGRAPEFLATRVDTQEVVAVEAKSRRRAGILGHPGEPEPDPGQKRSDLEQLIDSAMGQGLHDRPFWVFVDVNCPPVEGEGLLSIPWFPGLKDYVSSKSQGTPEDPDPFTALIVTNYSYHYLQSQRIGPATKELVVLPSHSRYPMSSEAFLNDVLTEVHRYGTIPSYPDHPQPTAKD